MQESADAHPGAAAIVAATGNSLLCSSASDKESNVGKQHSKMCILSSVVLSAGLISACHKAPPPVTQDDVAKAEADARKEVDDARLEARKDLKNAMKQAGSDSKNTEKAKVTGSFDVAMANADGDHKVAIEKCLMLEQAAQQACKDQADADYQAATANAKAARTSKTQGT